MRRRFAGAGVRSGNGPSPLAAEEEIKSNERRARLLGRRMTLIGFVAFNAGIGLCYGTFGVLVLHMEEMFGASRTAMGLALSLVALLHGLMAPIIGIIIPRAGTRLLMVSGTVLTSLGFGLLSFVQGSVSMLTIYGLLIGPGTALMGTLPVMTLISNWYAQGQGRMVGFALMPVIVTVSPMATIWLLPLLGLKGVLLAAAVTVAAIIPLQLLIVDRPSMLRLQPVGKNHEELREFSLAAPMRTVRLIELFRDPRFYMMATATGIVAGAGVAKSGHLVPILVEQGWPLDNAALLLSISGATGIFGSLMFGMVADRWSGATALACGAFVQAVVWLILIVPAGFLLLTADAIIIGMCGGGVISAKAVLGGRLFGRENFSYVMGASALASIPFVFIMSPLAGYLRQHTGNYDIALLVIIGLLATAGLMNIGLIKSEKRIRASDMERLAASPAGG